MGLSALIDPVAAVDAMEVIRIVSHADARQWRALALCAGHPDRASWFGESPEQTARAVAVCRACPVQQPCLEFALGVQEMFGIWGGQTPGERRRLLRTRSRMAGVAS